MSVALIADAHLGGPGGPATPLVDQLDSLVDRGCTRLVLMGDLFQIWVGHPGFETPEIREFVPALRRLRESGVKLHYVEGNRDFFLATSPYAELFDEVGTEVRFEVGGRKFLAVHGDGLNDRDWRYRGWRWLSKSPPSRFFVRRLPSRLANKIVDSTEERLGKSNFKHKIRLPIETIKSYGERRLSEGFEVLILGHFHEPHTLQVPGGEVRLLDAWYHAHRVEWIDEGGSFQP